MTTREIGAGVAADCHGQTLPAAAEMLLGVAGAILLLRLGTEPTSVRPRVALLAVGVAAVAWALFAFVVLPRTDLVCVN